MPATATRKPIRIYERTPDAALVYDPNERTKTLLIRDEGEISRVEVSYQCTTLDQAIDWLRPKSVPADAPRQGDLYFVGKFEDKHTDLRELIADAYSDIEEYGSQGAKREAEKAQRKRVEDQLRQRAQPKIKALRERYIALNKKLDSAVDAEWDRIVTEMQDIDGKIYDIEQGIEEEAYWRTQPTAPYDTAMGRGFAAAEDFHSTHAGTEITIRASIEQDAQIAQTRHYAENVCWVEKTGWVAFIGRRGVKTSELNAHARCFVKGRVWHEGHHEEIHLDDWHEVVPNKVSSLRRPHVD